MTETFRIPTLVWVIPLIVVVEIPFVILFWKLRKLTQKSIKKSLYNQIWRELELAEKQKHDLSNNCEYKDKS